ncbi:hypothetical protein AURDEDRAFT_167579 [Auricularia subglabra TFB-10046 SS5]|nr:hypothetical protein AURDEDRAFT_167579 [Auricularia subglabra TFB-10046 SS5]
MAPVLPTVPEAELVTVQQVLDHIAALGGTEGEASSPRASIAVSTLADQLAGQLAQPAVPLAEPAVPLARPAQFAGPGLRNPPDQPAVQLAQHVVPLAHPVVPPTHPAAPLAQPAVPLAHPAVPPARTAQLAGPGLRNPPDQPAVPLAHSVVPLAQHAPPAAQAPSDGLPHRPQTSSNWTFCIYPSDLQVSPVPAAAQHTSHPTVVMNLFLSPTSIQGLRLTQIVS